MKTIITTIGTSLFTNYLEKNGKDIESDYEEIKDLPYSEWNENQKQINDLKGILLKWLLDKNGNTAEIKSIEKIHNEVNEEISNYFICTDTIVSFLAGLILKEYFEKHNNSFICREVIRINGLQVNDYKSFELEGFPNLMDSMKHVMNKNKTEEMLFNITGGFKSIIPFITIFGQIYEIPIYYIYEDSDNLIRIPQLPIKFDWAFTEFYFPYLHLDEFGPEDQVYIDELEKNQLIIKQNKNKYSLTSLGKLLRDYSEQEMPFSKKVIGHFIEYKLFEYYYNTEEYFNIKHGHTIYDQEKTKEEQNEEENHAEIDLLLERKSDKNILAIESKSLLRIFKNKNWNGSTLPQITKQLRIFSHNTTKPIEYILWIYSNKDFTVSNENLNRLLEIQILVKEYLPNCSFSAYHYNLDINLYYREDNKNPYKKLLVKPIEKSDYKKIYP